MEIKNTTIMEKKSNPSIGQYTVYNMLSQLGSPGYSLSTSYAYWLWEKSDTIGNACDLISWAFQQITPALRDEKTGDFISGKQEHPFLYLLDNPGLQMSGDQFMYELMTSFLVTGECFPILTGNVNYEPAGMYTIGANEASLLEGTDGWLYQIRFTSQIDRSTYNREIVSKRNMWIYQTRDKLKETVQILNKKRRDGIHAQSSLDRVYYQALTKYYGNIHNTGLLKNASRPGGFWSPDGTPMSQQAYEAFKKEVNEHFTGPQNAGSNIIAPQPVKYQNLLLNPRDMDFLQLIENSRIEIYQQYQIPLPLVLAKTMTMSNYSKSIEALYDLSVLPRAKFILKQLGRFCLPRYKDGDRFELTIDEKQITGLKERMFERAKKMREIASYSEDEIRNETAYESLGEEGKQVWKPVNLLPSGEDDDFTSDQINRMDDELPDSEE